jgi:tryptophan synthase alpha chain
MNLQALKESGRKALVPYFVGGMSDDWLDAVRAAIHAGADAVEIGLPFSDPIMDGVVIQAAANTALARGATMSSILDELASVDVTVPLVAMTYFNIFHHRGLERAAADLARAGVSGAIVPDLSLEELEPWRRAANATGVSCVLMVAPSTPPDRLSQLANTSQGFVYAAARMAVTGASSDEGDSVRVVQAVRHATTTPVYVGIGITTPAQAAAATEVADGVIVGTAIVRRLLEGEGPTGIEKYVSELRRAID